MERKQVDNDTWLRELERWIDGGDEVNGIEERVLTSVQHQENYSIHRNSVK